MKLALKPWGSSLQACELSQVDQGTLDFDPEGQNLAQLASLASLAELQPSIPGYSLHERIGEGSFGEVWSATQRSTGQKVAVKLLHRNDLGALSYLEREVSRLAGLGGNPHLLSLIDANLQHVPAFLVTPLLQQSLEQCLGQEFSARKASRWLFEATSGLAYVHSRGVLHCDLKPSNLLRDQEGHIRLVDFGQAQLLQQRGSSLGTLWYMPPEQLPLGSRPPQPEVAWDLYALGATFYALLAGQPPRWSQAAEDRIKSCSEPAAQLEAYRDALRQSPLVPLRQRNPQLDRDLAAIIDHCLHLNPDHRYATAGEVLQDLERRQKRIPVLPRRHQVGYRARRFFQRNWLSAGLALLLTLGLGTTLRLQQRTSNQLGQLQLQAELDEALLYCQAQSIQGPLRLAQLAAQLPESWSLRMQLQANIHRAWRHRKQFKDTANEVWVCSKADRLALVNADNAGTLELFDASTFERVARLVHSRPLGRCSLSGDGQVLALPGHDGQLRLLRLADGKSEKVYQHPVPLLCAALEREQRQCLLGDESGQVLLWDLNRKSVLARWTHPAPLSFVVLSGDAQQAISADQEGGMQQWQLQPLKKVAEWKHPTSIMGLAYNAQGIWVACEDGKIYRNQADKPQEVLTHGTRLEGIQGISGGKTLSFGGRQARLWSSQGELLQEFNSPSPILSCRYSAESRRIVLGCSDGTLRLINAETGEVCLPGLRRPGEVRWVYLREDRQQLYCRSSVVEVWDLEGVSPFPLSVPVGPGLEEAAWGSTQLGLRVLTRQQLQLWDAEGFPRGRPLQLGGRPGRLTIEDDLLRVHFPANGVLQSYAVSPRGQLQLKDSLRVIPQVPLSPSGQWALRFDEATRQLAMTSLGSEATWNVAQESAALRLQGGALADDGQSLALLQAAPGLDSCSLSLYRRGATNHSRTLTRPFWLRFNAQGHLLYACEDGLTLFDLTMKELWKVSPSKPTAGEEPAPFYLADMDKAGRQMLIGDVHQLLWIDAETGKTLRKISPVGRLATARLHPDGGLVCTAGTQGAHLYRLEEDGGRVPLSELTMYTRAFFHPNLPLVALHSDQRVRVHSYAEINPAELPGLNERVQQRLGRRLEGQVEILQSPPKLPRK